MAKDLLFIYFSSVFRDNWTNVLMATLAFPTDLSSGFRPFVPRSLQRGKLFDFPDIIRQLFLVLLDTLFTFSILAVFGYIGYNNRVVNVNITGVIVSVGIHASLCMSHI